jgi:3-oxoadipate enol-lactonase
MAAVELNYERPRAGKGLPLLLGGSLGTTLEMWEAQMADLEGVDAIALDTRGHGHSPVPPGPYSIADLGGDVLALMDRLELGRASYAGLSIGGMVGQWLAVNAPERIERLILICTASHVPRESGYRERAAAVRKAGSPAEIAPSVVERWFTPGFAAEHPGLIERYRAMVTATPGEGYAGCAEAVAGHDERTGLGGVSASTLVIAGAQDPALPPERGGEIAEAIPGARFEKLDPAAHLANVERPERVSALIQDHLRGQP